MQRFSSGSYGGINNSASGGPTSRENVRAESSFATSNFSVNSRRQSQIAPYRLKCDKEPLNCRIGPPDFYPQSPNCLEETLTREYLQSGYKETVEGIEEAREITLSQGLSFSKPEYIVKCKEALGKRLRAINESRAQKRKAGQVYGVALSGQLLTKPGGFPEQQSCSEDFKRKWIEALSQQNKRLQSLAEHVPHGYRRKSLFEVLIRNNVPLIRASWFIKVNYLNQVRPGSSIDVSKARSELWTKDVTEYLQHLLDEFFHKDGSTVPTGNRDQPSPGFSSIHNSAISDTEEPSLHFKWTYVLRLFQWHYAEGLILPSLFIDWVFAQLQEKDSALALELLFPVLHDVIDSIALSQTYVRMFMDLTIKSINELSTSCLVSVDSGNKASFVSELTEMIRHLIVAVPDTFVALDCFPLPICVVPDMQNANVSLKSPYSFTADQFETQDAYLQYLSVGHVVSSIQRRSYELARVVSPSKAYGAAKVVQALDKALMLGDIISAYNSLFEDLNDTTIEERWIAEVSPGLKSSLKWIRTVSSSLICAVFFLCEWATSNYRDCRSMPQSSKFSGRKDISHIYFAVLILKLKLEDMTTSTESKEGSSKFPSSSKKNDSISENLFCGPFLKSFCGKSKRIFESPGPFHDIVVCWLDQHELGRTESSLNVEVLLAELIRSGIFYPQAYVRQLIISGVMDKSDNLTNLEKQSRHHRILKQLPGSWLIEALEETKFADLPSLRENFRVYSNERRFMLYEHADDKSNSLNIKGEVGRNKRGKLKKQISQLRVLISRCLHLPISSSVPNEITPDESQIGFKRASGSLENKGDFTEGTIGCEECKRAKRQKLESKNSTFQPFSINSDDEDTWWARKGTKSQPSSKVEIPLKSAKPSSRGRQKIVRKTQSLAQLAASRIESSQGASTSHVCENKISCPHHKSALETEVPKHVSNIVTTNISDIGKSLKQLRLVERRSISFWLLRLVKQLIEGNEKDPSKASNCTNVYSVPCDDNSAVVWRLGEDELLFILYVLDISCDLVSALKFLIWLVPRILSGQNNGVQSSRNQMLPKNRENQILHITDALLLSSLQRYENVLVAYDLLPELLTAVIQWSAGMTASCGRPSSSIIVAYARNLWRKYRTVANVSKWEKNFRATCDQRMLSELDGGRGTDGDSFFSFGVSAGVEDPDELIRQKMSVRMSRCVASMKELLQRNIEEAVRHFYAKKPSTADASKSQPLEKWDDTYLIAQDIVLGLVDLIRQNGGATPDIEPSMVASAVSAVLTSAGSTLVRLIDFTANSNHQNVASAVNSHNCIRHILQVHINALCLLKEAVGECLTRTFDIALATEASSVVSGAFAPSKANRAQFQLSPDLHDMYSTHSNEFQNNPVKVILGKSAKVAAVVTAVVIGAIVHGVSSLDRMVTAFRLREGLDVMQLIRGARSTSNGISRSFGTSKLDYCVEVYVHWFRVLIGNCKTVFDGLVAEVLGESYILALHRLQQMLPLNLVFPPAYAIFAMVIWRPYISNTNVATREDIQLYQYLSTAIDDATKHKPFRDLFFRNMQGFYDLLQADSGDSEFARMLELHSPDKQLKTMAFAPLRARLFLDALIDCRLPPSSLLSEDGSWVPGRIDPRSHAETEAKLLDQVVYILDTLQPAKFHWQWVELRLLLNEQAFTEKIDMLNLSLVDAIRSLSPTAENYTITESEKKVIEIILTRLLVRPDAASLYAEVVHLLGKSLQESFVRDTKWILAGQDVLLGRKSIRQQLISIAQRKGLPTKEQPWKPWGWSGSTSNAGINKVDKRKLETNSIEEGEVVDETVDTKRSGKMIQNTDADAYTYNQNYATENALTELIFPCIDRSSSDLRNSFATELIKQLGAIEQQVNGISHTGAKAGSLPSGLEGSSNKGNNRKGMRGGSPVLGRRPIGNSDSSPPSAAAVKASIWLRLQFLVRLLPIVYVDRDLKNMRQVLASCILRLLGTKVVYEEADFIFFVPTVGSVRREVDHPADTALSDYPSDTLFDRLLSVLYGLLSNCKPSWLKPKSASKSTLKSPRDCSAFDREAAEALQVELDRIELPARIRRRIQAAMPLLAPSPPKSVTCHPPTVPPLAVAPLQPSLTNSGPHPKMFPPGRFGNNLPSKNKNLPSQDLDVEVDPWTILEDGTGSTSVSSSGTGVGNSGSDHSNLKASNLLKGCVRVRRTHLTYIGPVDDDS